jgi:PEP-CTERM motif
MTKFKFLVALAVAALTPAAEASVVYSYVERGAAIVGGLGDITPGEGVFDRLFTQGGDPSATAAQNTTVGAAGIWGSLSASIESSGAAEAWSYLFAAFSLDTPTLVDLQVPLLSSEIINPGVGSGTPLPFNIPPGAFLGLENITGGASDTLALLYDNAGYAGAPPGTSDDPVFDFSTSLILGPGDYIFLVQADASQTTEGNGNAEVEFNLGFSDPNAIPEPGTLALVGLAIAGLGFAQRRRAA